MSNKNFVNSDKLADERLERKFKVCAILGWKMFRPYDFINLIEDEEDRKYGS